MESISEVVVVLPFVPGDADQFQRGCGSPKEICGGEGQSFARFVHLHPSHFGVQSAGSGIFAKNDDGAARRRILGITVSVRGDSMNCHKQRARLNLAGVAGNLANRQLSEGTAERT